jgi:hypothetical protein
MYDPHSQNDVRDSVHITRDVAQSSIMGFEINLGTEGVTVFMPFSSIASQMPADDARLLMSDSMAFLRRYGKVMIQTARDRVRKGELGSPEDLERFEATERMRQDMEQFDPEQAAVLADLRTGGVHGGVRA